MTAPHVIERLKNENNWLIVAKNDHEIALMYDALDQLEKWQFNLSELPDFDVCIYKMQRGWIKTAAYYFIKTVINYRAKKDLTNWFFKEVNNY